MALLQDLYSNLGKFLPFLGSAAIIIAGLWLARWMLLGRRSDLGAENRRPRQIFMMVLLLVGLACIVLALPMEHATRGQLVSLIGIALTVIVALSSTTFVANVMAGFMLRAVRSFHPGDIIRVGDQYGRVTERGFFHTEIQTEDRDLTTLPNLYLVSNPFTVVRASGTFVSARLSLGYDVSHAEVELLFVEAAKSAGLQETFVRIVDLGDYSVTYQVAGFLADIKHLLTTRSELRRKVLDTLHEAGIEIVSPSFMNQRVLKPGERFLPKRSESRSPQTTAESKAPESIIFDKADEAEKIEKLGAQRAEVLAAIKDMTSQLGALSKEERPRLQAEIDRARQQVEDLEAAIEQAEQAHAEEH